jgi:hypothetical protein
LAVTVRVVGDLRRFADGDTFEVADGPCTIRAAVNEVIGRNPELSAQIFDREGRLQYGMVLSLNGRTANWSSERDIQIENGDELLLTRFHSGG